MTPWRFHTCVTLCDVYTQSCFVHLRCVTVHRCNPVAVIGLMSVVMLSSYRGQRQYATDNVAYNVIYIDSRSPNRHVTFWQWPTNPHLPCCLYSSHKSTIVSRLQYAYYLLYRTILMRRECQASCSLMFIRHRMQQLVHLINITMLPAALCHWTGKVAWNINKWK